MVSRRTTRSQTHKPKPEPVDSPKHQTAPNGIVKKKGKRRGRPPGSKNKIASIEKEVEAEVDDDPITSEITDSLAALQAHILHTTIRSITSSHDALQSSLGAVRDRLALRATHAATLLGPGGPFAPFGDELLEFTTTSHPHTHNHTTNEDDPETDVPNTSDLDPSPSQHDKSQRTHRRSLSVIVPRPNGSVGPKDRRGKGDKSLPVTMTARLSDRMKRLSAGMARHEKKAAALLAEWRASEEAVTQAGEELAAELTREAEEVREIEKRAKGLVSEIEMVVEGAVREVREDEKGS